MLGGACARRVTRKGAAEEAGPGRRDWLLSPCEGQAGRWEVRGEFYANPMPAPSSPLSLIHLLWG